MVDKKKMKDKKKKGVKEDDNRKKKKAKKVRRKISSAQARVNQCLPQVENLTTPLISYVGSGVPQEVLDMPVDPNEPTYCTCQQVTFKHGIVVQDLPKTQKLGSQFVLH